MTPLSEYPCDTLDDGMLSPGQFLVAGDRLVGSSPMWQWQSGAKEKARAFLPEQKQFLICTGLSANTNQNAMNAVAGGAWEAMDEWVDAAGTGEDSLVFIDVLGHDMVGSQDQDEDEKQTHEPTSDDVKSRGQRQRQGITRAARLYDLSITYDRYYKCPRFWLSGRDTNTLAPLTPEQLLSNFIQDQANKTATVELHPNLPNLLTVSIHPCQHAKTMVSILKQVRHEVRPEEYLFLFLKVLGLSPLKVLALVEAVAFISEPDPDRNPDPDLTPTNPSPGPGPDCPHPQLDDSEHDQYRI